MLAADLNFNVLINNAGIMRRESLTERRDLRDSEETVVTNFLGPIRLTTPIDHPQRQAGRRRESTFAWLVPLSHTPLQRTKAALHSYTVALRAQLKDKVEVIELVPPGVQTELTPGHDPRRLRRSMISWKSHEGLSQEPTPREILVERVEFLRWAERDGHFDRAVEMLAAL